MLCVGQRPFEGLICAYFTVCVILFCREEQDVYKGYRLHLIEDHF